MLIVQLTIKMLCLYDKETLTVLYDCSVDGYSNL